VLTYNNTYDQQGDDVGGAKVEVDVPLTWTGARVGGEGGPGDAFNLNDTWHGYATDPWNKSTIVPNLNPGDWNLAVTVNGLPLSCPGPITLSAGAEHTVTFEIEKVGGQFTGCTHN